MTPPSGPTGGGRGPGGPLPGPPGAPRRDPGTPRREPPAPHEPGADAPSEAPGEPVFAESPHDTVVEDLDDLLDVVRRERDEFRDMAQRVQADFENYKKRMQRQQSDHLERAAEDLVMKVLPVLDAFDLARAHLGEGEDLSPEGKALVAGSNLLADSLAREGLERIDDAGAPFDPTTHEAVDRVDTDPAGAAAGDGATSAGATGAGAADAGEAGATDGPVVDEVLRAGYRWKGRVIRPAMVRVRG